MLVDIFTRPARSSSASTNATRKNKQKPGRGQHSSQDPSATFTLPITESDSILLELSELLQPEDACTARSFEASACL